LQKQANGVNLENGLRHFLISAENKKRCFRRAQKKVEQLVTELIMDIDD